MSKNFKDGFWAIIPCMLIGIFVFSFRFNGLLDMPNHLARSYIMKQCLVNATDPICENFVVTISPLPYFLADFTLVGYLSLFPPLMAEKMAVFSLLSLFIIAWYRFYIIVNSHVNVGYVAGLFLVLSNYFFNGFFAYLASIVLSLFWLSYWWTIRDRKTYFNQIVLSLFMVVIFGFHLAGFLFVSIISVLYDINKYLMDSKNVSRYSRTILLRSIPVPLTFFSLYALQQYAGGSTFLGATHYKLVLSKFISILYPFINYSIVLDISIVGVLFVLLLLSIDMNSLRNIRRNFWALVSVMFFVLFIATPTEAHGVYDFDVRFLPLAYLSAFLAIGSVEKDKPLYVILPCVLLFISFLASFYYKDITNRQLSKVYDVMELCEKDKSLIEINSIRNFPYQTGSRVGGFPYFGCYYILDGGRLVGGLFDSKYNRNITYFSYKNEQLRNLDYFRYQFLGIKALEDKDIYDISRLFDYILLIGNEDVRDINSKIRPEVFSIIHKSDNIYLFGNRDRLNL